MHIINPNLTIVIFCHLGRPISRFRSTEPEACGRAFAVMTKQEEATQLSWPWWAPWALLAVAVTSVLTVAAALYDIL